MKKYSIWIIAIVLAVLAAIYVAKLIGKDYIFEPSNKPRVATTIFPLYDITRIIAGEAVDVSLIVDGSGSPHTFSLSSGKLKEVSKAGTIFSLGHGIDNYIVDEFKQALVINSVVVDNGSIFLSDGAEGEDPHYWLSLNNAQAIGISVSNTLIELYPDSKVEFQSNLAVFTKNIAQLKDYYQGKFLDKSVKIATFHNAFSYLANSVGFEIVTTFEEFPGEEPTPQWLNSFTQKIKENNLTVIYAEPQFSTTAIDSVAQDLGLQIETLDPLGGNSLNYSYITLIKNNLDIILQPYENKEEELNLQ